LLGQTDTRASKPSRPCRGAVLLSIRRGA
jgi:hypothetical protein